MASNRHDVFVNEYVIDLNGTRAAIAAGYTAHSARSGASRLLKNANIRAAIDQKLAELAQKCEISAEKVLNGLKTLAFFDIRKFFREDGSLKSIPELDDQTQAALCEMKIEKPYEHCGERRALQKGTLTKIKVADRGRNLERLGRHLNLFTHRVEPKGTMRLAEILAKARKRVAERGTG